MGCRKERVGMERMVNDFLRHTGFATGRKKNVIILGNSLQWK